MEEVKSSCPECNTKSLQLREKEIYCKHCKKVIFKEFPKTPEGKQEIINALTDYVKTCTK